MSRDERFGLTMGVRPGPGAKGRQSLLQRSLHSASAAVGALPNPLSGGGTSLIRRDFTSQDQLALRQGGQVMDPQEDLAKEYRLLGRRIPDPYAHAAAREIEFAQRFRTLHAGEVDLWPDDAVYPAPSRAGWRTTQFGGVGLDTGDYLQDPHGRLWDARRRVGAREFGSRDGTMTELDIAERNRFLSGILGPRQAMNMAVTPERPYLTLRCAPINFDSSTVVRVVARALNGMESERVFVLGGGFTASFMLDGYQNVLVETTDMTNATDQLQWSWNITGVWAADQTLYLPANVAVTAPPNYLAVPEGAFEVSVAVDCPAWRWRTSTLGFGVAELGAQNLLVVNNPHRVLGTLFCTGAQIAAPLLSVCWAKRPI